MGKPTTAANEQASIVVSGSFTATGQSGNAITGYGLGKTGGEGGQAPAGGTSGSTVAPAFFREFNAAIYGTFVGSIQLERSFDGTNWGVVTLPTTGAAAVFTAPTNFIMFEPEYGVTYRWNCTAYTSGTINYRISQ